MLLHRATRGINHVIDTAISDVEKVWRIDDVITHPCPRYRILTLKSKRNDKISVYIILLEFWGFFLDLHGFTDVWYL